MIVGANSLPICRFCTCNGLLENTTSLLSTRLFVRHRYSGSETAVRNYLTALREEIGPKRRPRRYYPPVSKGSKHHQHPGLSSRRATWLVLRRPENCSAQDQRTLDLVKQAHPQVRAACELAQALAQMIGKRNASALDSWLEGASTSGVPELRTFAAGIKRDQASILAALTYEWSQGQVEGQINRLKPDLSPSLRTSRV